jgi:hypothetical protein
MTTADYYRTHGDSANVRAVEAALDDVWRTTLEIAERCGKSAKWIRLVLVYLLEEGRVERRQEAMERPFYGQRWKWVWRRVGNAS